VVIMKKTNKLFLILSSIVSFTFPLVLSSCYAFFQGKVAMNADGNTSTLATIVADTVVITKLSAPEQIFVSDGLYADRIQVSWSAVEGAASYRLERAVVMQNSDGTYTAPDESEYNVIKASQSNPISSAYVTATTYSDLILSEPAYTDEEYTYGYFYRVSAENTYKKYDSSEYTKSCAGTLFAPATNVKASLGVSTENITVTWTKNTKASYYKIYRSQNADGTNSVYIGRVTSNQNWYKDIVSTSQQGVEYYYTLYAQNASGNMSVSSSIALGYALVDGAPPQVKNVVVTNGRGTTTKSITIKWDLITDATYAIYRTSSVDSAYTLLGTVQAGTNSKEDTQSLKTNVYYYYQVQAIKTDSSGTEMKGPFSASSATDAAPAEGYLLSPPSSLSVIKVLGSTNCKFIFSAALGSESCLLNSGKYTDYNTYTYSFFGGTTTDVSTMTEITGVTLADPTLGYYTVTVPNNGGYKFFAVQTNHGTVSSVKSAVAAPVPYPAKATEATKHAFISGITDVYVKNADGTTMSDSQTNANSSGVYPVKITWNAPDEGADGGYYVYRSTKSTESFRRITDAPVTDLYYVDYNDTAKTGTYYYYKILSLNSLLQGTNFSNVATGYGALTYNQYMREYNKTIMHSQKKLTLMHKAGSTAKLGTETISGDITGTLYYNAAVQGLGGRVIMTYTNYADYFVNNDSANGYYFFVNVNTNTSASMDASGTMDGTVTCTGMYPGSVAYDNIEIKGGAAGGGYYVITPEGFKSGNTSYTVGNE